jgi:hypothetical protein
MNAMTVGIINMSTNGRLTRSVPRGAVHLRKFKLGRPDFRKDAPAAFEE